MNDYGHNYVEHVIIICLFVLLKLKKVISFEFRIDLSLKLNTAQYCLKLDGWLFFLISSG